MANVGTITFKTKVDTKTFDKQIEELEDKIKDLELAKIQFTADGDTANLQAVNVELEKAKNKLIGLQKQQEQINVSSQKSFKGISNGMEGVLRKVSKWALAIFGIRSAYMLVRRSVSQLSQYDENLANQLQYISWTIAQAIAPVVRWIVNAVYLILQYVNQITQSLFGLKLFKGPDEFAKSMKKASGSAKEIQKSLAGFDEMNVLGGNTRQAGGGATMPEFDTESVLNSIDKFTNGVKKLGKNFRKEIQDMYDALDNPQAFTDAYGKWDMLVYGITELFAGLGQSIIGVFDVIGGWSKIITGLINGDWEQMTEGVKQVWRGTFEFLKGIWTMIVGAFDTIIGGIKGIVLSIWEYIVEKFSSLKTILTLAFSTLKSILIKPFNALKKVAEEVLDWISEKLGPLFEKVGGLKENISNIMKNANTSSVKSGVSNQVASGLGYALGSKIKSIFGLAKGTILNNPGQGVPLSNVVAGEQGREALIPLSDSQLLEELGSTIGRYVQINLTNITELDGSTIARKVSKINQENNFATNR